MQRWQCPNHNGTPRNLYLIINNENDFVVFSMFQAVKLFPAVRKITFVKTIVKNNTKTAHTLYLDRLSRPIVSRHAMLRFHVMFSIFKDLAFPILKDP